MPTDSYFYPSRQLAKFMTSTQIMSNSCGLVRMQKMSAQWMITFHFSVRIKNMSTQNMSNLHVCSTNKSESKNVHVDKRESKRINVKACFTEKSEAKSVH